MDWGTVVLALALLTSAAARADGPPVAPDGRLRTVIAGVVGRRGVTDQELTAALSDVVQGVYATDHRRVVIGRGDIQRVLEMEADKQSLGCATDKCLLEIGSAMDAQRLVSGTLDKIGADYLVMLSEIDAKTLEPIARQQAQIAANDETLLVTTLKTLATTLLAQSGSGAATPTAGGALAAAAGSIEINTEPRNAAVILNGVDLGKTPTRVDNIAVGTLDLRLVRDDYEPVEVEVPVFAGGTTAVNAQLRILRPLAEQNLAARRAAWRDDDFWHTLGGWTKAGTGGAAALLGVGMIGNGLLGGSALSNPVMIGVAVGALGGGLIAWGVVDLANPVPPPVPEWEVERAVTVTPPKGQGDAQVRLLQKGTGEPTHER